MVAQTNDKNSIEEENKKVYISHMYYSGSEYINKI